MKKLILLICVILASCSTVHKNISSVKKTEDSVTVMSKDTSSISSQFKKNDDFTAKGINITVTYDSSKIPNSAVADTVHWTPLYVPKKNVPYTDKDYVSDLVNNMVSALPSTARIPYSVSIHIDSVSNVSNVSFNKDSVGSTHKDLTNVKTNIDSKDKVVSKSGLGAGVYIILGIVVLIFVVIAVIKFKLW